MTKIQKHTLGLDMGTNFIGWAVVEHDDNLRPPGLFLKARAYFRRQWTRNKLNQCWYARYGTGWVSLR